VEVATTITFKVILLMALTKYITKDYSPNLSIAALNTTL
jgi:hypothetical protein